MLDSNTVAYLPSALDAASRATLAELFAERGYAVHPIEFGEFRKGGSGIKCCVLTLHEDPSAASAICSHPAVTAC